MAQLLTDVLGQIRGGAALIDAGKDLAELVKAVKECGKAGSITFKITVEPDKTDDTVVTLQPDVTCKMPKKPRAKGLFYVDAKTGALFREDPRQLELEMERKAAKEATAAELHEKGITTIGRG
jgi:leucyl aminopeptidase (aminopeptidase T)